MKSVFGGPQRHYYMFAKAQNCQALSLPFLFLLPYLKKQRDGDRFLFGTLIFSETVSIFNVYKHRTFCIFENHAIIISIKYE